MFKTSLLFLYCFYDFKHIRSIKINLKIHSNPPKPPNPDFSPLCERDSPSLYNLIFYMKIVIYQENELHTYK